MDAISRVKEAKAKLKRQRDNWKRKAERIVECIPTTWLDGKLTGPNAILPKGYNYKPTDIEKLLLAIRKEAESIFAPAAAKGGG